MAGDPESGERGIAEVGRRKLQFLRSRPAFWFSIAMAALFLVVAWLGPKPFDAEAQKRFALEKPRPEDYAGQVLLWIALGNAIVAGFLAMTARWWGQPFALRGPVVETNRPAWEGEIFWGALLVIVALGFFLRLPLAQRSLWWDEIWTLKNAVSGYSEIREDGSERFVKRDWARTFWHYSKPTNHVGFSVPSRVCLEAWRKLTHSSREQFNEFAFRLPSILAGVGSILLIGWLARDSFGTLTGLGSALLLAVHPWFIRYTVDGRAFGLTVFWLLLAWAALRCLLIDGARWFWWFVYGFATLMLLWVFPYNIYVPLGLSAAVVLALAITKYGTDRWLWFGRFVVTNVFAALCFLQLAGPWIPQALKWKDVEGSDMAGPVLSPGLLDQTWKSFTTGLPAATEIRADPLPSFETVSKSALWFQPFIYVVLPGLAIVGLVGLGIASVIASRNGGPTPSRRCLIPVLGTVLALAAALGVAWIKRHYFYDRYVIYALPSLIVLIGAGIWSISRLLKPHWLLEGMIWIAVAGMFAAATSAERSVLLGKPIAPIRDVAHFLAQSAEQEPGVAMIGYGLGGDTPAIYEPRVEGAFDPGTLLTRLGVARTAGKPAYVFYGYNSFNRANGESNARDAFVFLDNRTLFESVMEFAGIEDQFRYRVFRYTGVDPETLNR